MVLASSLVMRDWSVVDAAIAAAVAATNVLPGDDGPLLLVRPGEDADRSTDRITDGKRVTWQLAISYYGPAFSGFAWQAAAPKPTVQGCLQEALLPLLGGRSELRFECAGRTDAGVSSLGNLVSFHSDPGVRARDLFDAVARSAPTPGVLRLVDARRMERGYHATFSTAWRQYAYLLPPAPDQTAKQVAEEANRLDAMLQPLAGERRDYSALGRGVPVGKDTSMLLRHASARVVNLPSPAGESAGGVPMAMTRIELVGDRFLRRQVRSLVATAVAISEQWDGPVGSSGIYEQRAAERLLAERLLTACTSGDSASTALEAPAVGLVLVGAGTADEMSDGWRVGAEALCGRELDALPTYSLDRPSARTTHASLISRFRGRLEARLAAAGMQPTPRMLSLACLRLCSELSIDHFPPLAPPMTAAEEELVAGLALPLELANSEEAGGEAGGESPLPELECPEWAWPRLVSAFGQDAGMQLRALQQPAPLDLRVNTLRSSRDEALTAIRRAGFKADPTRYSPVGIRIDGGADPRDPAAAGWIPNIPMGRIPGISDGTVEPQDEGAQLVTQLLGARPGESVMVYCAGSGAKALAIAAQMQNKGRLVAADGREALLARAAARCAKAGVDNVQCHLIAPGPDKCLSWNQI